MSTKTKAELLEEVAALKSRIDELERQEVLSQNPQIEETSFRHLAENIGEVFWVADAHNYSFSYISPAFSKVWERSCESLINEPRLWLESVHTEDRLKVSETLYKELRQHVIDIVYRIVRPGGKVRWVRNRATPIRDDTGDVSHIAGLVVDITEWKRQEAARIDGEARLRAVMASTLDPMLTVGSKGIVQMASNSVENVFGWTPQELIGQNIKILLPEPYRSNHDQYLRNYFRTGKTNILGQTREFEAVRKDGTSFPCELTIWRTDLPGQKEPLFTGIIRDITLRKRSEEALLESREWLSTTLTCIGDGVIATDTEGKITFMNPVTRRLTGWDDDSIGQPLEKVFHIINEHTRKKVESTVSRVLREGKIVGLANHTALISRDGTEYCIADSGSPIRNLEGDICGAVLVFRDVTEIKQAERQSREHQEELAHVMRLSTMGEMASGMAHELNQPLTAITAYAEACSELLKIEAPVNANLIEISHRISEQAQRAGEIIRQLRKFVSKQEPLRSPMAINDAIREVAMLLGPEALTKNVRMEFDLKGDLPPVFADMIQIEQVILNLVRNGFEAMSEQEPTTRQLTIRTVLNENGMIEVSVSDTGKGVSQEDLAHVFDPFFTTKTEGMGVGLSISRSIIESHRGRLTASQNTPGGATFQFMLPTQEEILPL